MSIICKTCGAPCEDGSKICRNCGDTLAGQANQQVSYSGQTSGTYSKPSAQASYQQQSGRTNYNQPSGQTSYQQAIGGQQSNFQQNSYQQTGGQSYTPSYNNSAYAYGSFGDEEVSTKSWVGWLLLMCIPVVNIIMLIILAAGSSQKRSLKNFAKAYLIVIGIGVAISILLTILMVILGISATSFMINAV